MLFRSNYLTECVTFSESLSNKIPELPFSNIWIAQQGSAKLPSGSSIHFGILNSLRSWNFFKLADNVTSFSNVGGFGIDGCVSTLIGASLANKHKLYFGVIGDLAFFYDLNSIGNRFVGSNLRILIVNNGKGVEFKHFNHPASCFGSDADLYMAASGHYGNKSQTLVKNYAENLGFKYISASNKNDFARYYSEFISINPSSKPILFEVFTNEEDECQALDIMSKIEVDMFNNLKNTTKKIIGDKGVSLIKKIGLK